MRILVVDDHRAARQLLLKVLASVPYVEVAEAKSLDEAISSIQAKPPDLVLLDIRLSSDPEDRAGLDLLRRVRASDPGVVFVVVSSSSEVDLIREAMRLGARDYVFKDEICAELLVPVVETLRERMELRGEVVRLRERVEKSWGLSAIVGGSSAIKQVKQFVRRVADSDATVLIRGETGTGKELVARAIHEVSPRRGQPFVAINCASLPAALMESLMFGHERGAFTGADSRKAGQLELAGAGTILLDEVAEMPVELQAKLLRVLEERRFRPLGSTSEVPLAARVLASTHVDLEARLANGQFRDDLYYRLNVISIALPSLDDRRTDIPELVYAFAKDMPRTIHFKEDAMDWLTRRNWPGNVRELRNVVERVSLLTVHEAITRKNVEILGAPNAQINEIDRVIDRLLALPEDVGNKLALVERSMISRALASVGGNMSEAARRIGISRQVLDRRWQRLEEEASEGDDAPEPNPVEPPVLKGPPGKKQEPQGR